MICLVDQALTIQNSNLRTTGDLRNIVLQILQVKAWSINKTARPLPLTQEEQAKLSDKKPKASKLCQDPQ